MKIVHVTTYHFGGAGIAAKRISDILCRIGIKSTVLTRDDFGLPPLRDPMPILWRGKRKIKYLINKCQKASNPIQTSWGLCGAGIVQQLNAIDTDFVHLHWINDGLLSVADIPKIRKPIIWTLHDSWAFCGAEHHQNLLENDIRYQDGYSSSNFPETSSGLDLNKWIWRWKKYCWKNLRCTFTAPSRWEAGCFETSALFHGQKCHVIPNCLNQKIYFPSAGKEELRRKWQLPLDKKILLFGAQMSNNPIKGGQYLKAALKLLAEKRDDLFLLCFGAGKDSDFQNFEIPYRFTGSLSGDEVLASVYQAADVFICPSVIDNLPNTCVEAISCGIPVAAFEIGGVPDIVCHKENGYLAQPYQTDDLAAGILYCLEHRDILSKNARRYAESHFSEEIVAAQYIKLYQEISEKQ